MKYEEANYVKDGVMSKIQVGDHSPKDLEGMLELGEFYCPEENCRAKLCLVHHSKNGGRTYFLKAVGDDKHGEDCDYKIGNYKAISIREPENGYFTEEQLNRHARMVDKDISNPITSTDKKKEKSKDKKINVRVDETNEKQVRKTANTGRIVYGEEGVEGTKGRMSRTYNVRASDIGKIKTIYGNAKQIYLDEYKQLRIDYKDIRLGNIEVLVGPIIENNYPTIYGSLYLAENYFKDNRMKKEIRVTANGLITEKNGRITMELLTAGGLIIDGDTINGMRIKNVNRDV